MINFKLEDEDLINTLDLPPEERFKLNSMRHTKKALLTLLKRPAKIEVVPKKTKKKTIKKDPVRDILNNRSYLVHESDIVRQFESFAKMVSFYGYPYEMAFREFANEKTIRGYKVEQITMHKHCTKCGEFKSYWKAFRVRVEGKLVCSTCRDKYYKLK